MAKDKRDPEDVAARIRELNEQVLETGRKAGLEFLEAYEQMLRGVADYHDRLADASQVDWITNLVRAQANFTREIAEAYAKVGRGTLNR